MSEYEVDQTIQAIHLSSGSKDIQLSSDLPFYYAIVDEGDLPINADQLSEFDGKVIKVDQSIMNPFLVVQAPIPTTVHLNTHMNHGVTSIDTLENYKHHDDSHHHHHDHKEGCPLHHKGGKKSLSTYFIYLIIFLLVAGLGFFLFQMMKNNSDSPSAPSNSYL